MTTPTVLSATTRHPTRTAGRYVPVEVREDLPPVPAGGLSSSAFVVVADPGGAVSGALVPRLIAAGAPVLLVAATSDSPEQTAAEFARTLPPDDRPLTVVNLHGIGAGRFDDPGSGWPDLVDERVWVNLVAAQAYHARLSQAGSRYVAVTDVADAAGRATAGFVKSFALELGAGRATVVELNPSDPGTAADLIVAELAAPPGRTVEVRHTPRGRHIIQVVPNELDVDPRRRDGGLLPGDVVVVTGGGRGITYECAAALADVPGVHVVLLGRTAPPSGAEPWLAMTDREFAAHRSDLMRAERQARPEGGAAGARASVARTAAARELHHNLARLRARNPLVRYERCDVADPAQVQATVAAVHAELGPVTGVVHGAGIESIDPVRRKDIAHARRVVRIKAGGAYALWHAVRADQPRFFVLFGSMNGRFGMDGQADYGAGADLMSAVTAGLATAHPRTRSFTLAWTAWSGTGMAAGAAVRRIQEQQRGLQYIPVAEGVQAFVRELCHGGREPEVLVFGRTGRNDLGGQDGALTADQRAVATPVTAGGWPVDRVRLSLLGRVTRLDGHRVRATCGPHPDGSAPLTVPLQIEALAEAASLLAPGDVLTGIEDAEFATAASLRHVGRPSVLSAERVDGGHRVTAALWVPGEDRPRVRAAYLFGAEPSGAVPPRAPAGAVTRIRVPDVPNIAAPVPDPRFLTAPLLVHEAWRSALAWTRRELGGAHVPAAVAAIRFHRQPRRGETVCCHLTLTAATRRPHLDIRLTDTGGAPICDIHRLVLHPREEPE